MLCFWWRDLLQTLKAQLFLKYRALFSITMVNVWRYHEVNWSWSNFTMKWLLCLCNWFYQHARHHFKYFFANMRLMIQFQLSFWRTNSTVLQGVMRRDQAPHNLRLLKSQLWFILTSCGGWLISGSRRHHQTNTISKWSPSPPSLLHLIITVGFLLSLLYAAIFFRKRG